MATTLDPRSIHRRAREAILADNWWAAAIRGVSPILFGSLALFMPAVTLVGLVMIFAAYSFVDGVFSIVLAVRGARHSERWGWVAFHGIVSIAAAVAVALYPLITIFLFTILFGAWALISGGASIAAGAVASAGHGRWWLILGGIIAILFGMLAIFAPPLGMLAIAYMVGFQAWLAGFIYLARAFQLRSRKIEAAGTDTVNRSADAVHAQRPEATHG
ncbi:MAG: hypothetical protein JWN69_2493 [Alphaproteobacteria bacterium]|nr:hypothetical protein [Alphaproteobacteria bacterium]